MSVNGNSDGLIRVAVIGCGVAGLAMGRHLLGNSDRFAFTIYEQTNDVGGTWVYSDRIGTDENGLQLHTSMYKQLKTIIPKEAMAYLDYPFAEGGENYVPHYEMLKYVNDYCDHFDIRKHIKFLTKVVNVSPEPTTLGRGHKWNVVAENVLTKVREIQQFDAVSVCNGHYAQPKYVPIQDFEKYNGQMLHSHYYREPKIFTGKNVLVLGAGASALDIALQASKVAKKVALSYQVPHLWTATFPDDIKVLPWVRSAELDGFVFDNGEYFSTDIVVFCTGYHFSFPFLSRDCGIEVHQRRVTNLYKHMINIKYPTMAFVGIPLLILPGPVSEIQALYFLKTLTNPELLPSEQEMVAHTNDEMAKLLEEGKSPKHFHRLGEKTCPYMYDLIKSANIPITIPPWLDKLYQISGKKRTYEFPTFRQYKYTIKGNDVIVQ